MTPKVAKIAAIVKTMFILFLVKSQPVLAQADYNSALRRAQYLLNGTLPTSEELSEYAASQNGYYKAVRSYIGHDNFYQALMRYHEKLFGTGLDDEYIDELLNANIDNKSKKFAQLNCQINEDSGNRYRCFWASEVGSKQRTSQCVESQEEAATVFWYPGVIAWVCPSIIDNCGSDLSRCFITYDDEDVARSSELGTTEIFDSRFAVVKSLAKQSAGIATAVVLENLPYTQIIEPGLTAIDGAIAHFYRQPFHFNIEGLQIDASILNVAKQMPLTNTQFQLVKSSGNNAYHAGVLTSFGWMRRYAKNRTRANELYERLLCKRFTSELPAVFPQDPGNLRETPGCRDCHSVLDPLADYFRVWGEEGSLYEGGRTPRSTEFAEAGCDGSTPRDLARCLQQTTGFAACQVQNVWQWLMGRQFYQDEASLRDGFTDYFIQTGFSFRELVYAVATHPSFMVSDRGDAEVSDPIEEPPLGQITTIDQLVCDQDEYSFTADIKSGSDSLCLGCHNGNTTAIPLVDEDDWQAFASDAIQSMGVRRMPRGSPDWDEVNAFRNRVRCWIRG